MCYGRHRTLHNSNYSYGYRHRRYVLSTTPGRLGSLHSVASEGALELVKCFTAGARSLGRNVQNVEMHVGCGPFNARSYAERYGSVRRDPPKPNPGAGEDRAEGARSRCKGRSAKADRLCQRAAEEGWFPAYSAAI